jgi:TonB-linked SusC/RagA family outer membrane protein
MSKLLLFCSLLMLMAARGYSQTKTVTGTVTDKTSIPLPAVTVMVVETKDATSTDINGKFKIQVAAGQHLNISYIGAKSQIVAVTASTINLTIQLEFESSSLSEIVVTGYTSERKKDLTGAVSVVNLADIEDIPAGNPMKALQGMVPGLQIANNGNVNGAVGVTLRGITTLNDNDPLYVIDGIPTQRGLQEINQNDIESIQVLRDASAASIYGSRAAAGVIIITTKKGKNGVSRIDFDASTSLQFYNTKLTPLNTQQRATAYWQAQVNDDEFGINYVNQQQVNPSEFNGVFTYNWNNNYSNPVLNSVIIPKYIDPAQTMLAANTNWFNEISQNSILQQYNLTISSGTEKGNSLFSLGYFDNQGIIKETRDTKYNVRYNSDFNLFNNRVKIGETLSATYMRDPILPVNSITILSLIESQVIPVHTVNGGWGGPINGMDDRDNPVRLIEDNKQNVNAFGRVFGNAYVDAAILPNLHFKSTFSGDFAGNYFRSVQLPYVAGFLSNPATYAGQSTDYEVTLTWQNQLTYDLKFGKSKLNLLLGEENIKNKYQNFNGQDQGLALADINYAYLSEGTSNVIVNGGGSGDALLSYFAKVNYSFADKYLLSATVRRDGSSKFGQNNQYATFPAGSVGWRLSQEDFIKSIPLISDLKLRYGWGQTGNQNIANNGIYTLYQSIYSNAAPFNGDSGSAYDINGKGSGTLPSGFTSIQTGNPKLKWETTTQSNIGLDYALFNSTLSGSFDWFYKNTTNILINPPYLAVLGEGGGEYLNGASLQNRGFEAIISYKGKVSNDLSFNITGNIALYRNKVTYLPQDVLTGYPGNGTTQTVLGRSVNSEYGYVVEGIFQNAAEVSNSAAQPGKGVGRLRYADLNGDGVIDQNDEKFLGTSDPNFVYGLNTSVSYKAFNLSFFFQGVQGGLVYNNYKYLTDFSSLAPGSNWGTRTLQAWTPTNTKSTIPALTLVNNNDEGRYSSYFLESGSYLKLRDIQLAYNLKTVIKGVKFQRAKIYIQASNLLKFKSSSYTGPDPENPANLYPIPAVTTIGVNFSY